MVQHLATFWARSRCSTARRSDLRGLVGESKQQILWSRKERFQLHHYLGAWLIWKHRNSCVFDGGRPNLAHVISTFKEEAHLWAVAGARGVSHLLALASAS